MAILTFQGPFWSLEKSLRQWEGEEKHNTARIRIVYQENSIKDPEEHRESNTGTESRKRKEKKNWRRKRQEVRPDFCPNFGEWR